MQVPGEGKLKFPSEAIVGVLSGMNFKFHHIPQSTLDTDTKPPVDEKGAFLTTQVATEPDSHLPGSPRLSW